MNRCCSPRRSHSSSGSASSKAGERRLQHIEDRLLSLSSVSRDKIGARADDMIAELRAKLAPFVVDDALSEVVESQALIAMRPPPHPDSVGSGGVLRV